MSNVKIKFGNIVKRSSCINSSILNEHISDGIAKDFRALLNNLNESNLKDGTLKPSIKNKSDQLLNSLCNLESANECREIPFVLMESFKESPYSTEIANEYVRCILPYIVEMSTLPETMNRYSINDNHKKIISEAIATYTVVDRILENHKTISKRFNIESEVTKNKDFKSIVESCCSMIDTYNLAPYKKLNLLIEELTYLFNKNGIKYESNELVESATSYFLLNSRLDNITLNGYKKALTESSCLDSSSISSVSYLFEESIEGEDINSNIHRYLIDKDKSDDLLEDIMLKCMGTDAVDMSYNIDKFLYFILELYKSEVIMNDNHVDDIVKKGVKVFESRLKDLVENDDNIDRNFIDNIVNALTDFITYVPDTDANTNICLNNVKEMLRIVEPYRTLIYTEYNLSVLRELNNCEVTIPVNESLLFKHNGLIRAVRNLDKYLGEKCKNAYKAIGNKISNTKQKIDNILFPEREESKFEKAVNSFSAKVKDNIAKSFKKLFIRESLEELNLYKFINEDNKFDMLLYYTEINEDTDDLYNIHTELSELCEEFNLLLEKDGYNTFKCYYLINPGMAEIHIQEAMKLDLTDMKIDESADINYTFSNLDPYVEMFCKAISESEYIDSIDNKDLETSLFDYFKDDKTMSIDKFDTILEALSMLEVPKETVRMFGEKFLDSRFYSLSESTEYESEAKIIKNIIEAYEPEENVPRDIKFETYLIYDALLEANEEDDEDEFIDDSDEDFKVDHNIPKEELEADKDKKMTEEEKIERRKNPYKGINLTSIKLFLKGVKAKFKKLTQKGKEIFKSVDLNLNRFVKSIRDSMVSDRREAILTGSVIPSFSKCIRQGIMLAGSYVVSGFNPAVPAIIALGNFAVNKSITNKERALLLDEIETELEVVDKEIQLAEREDDIKRFRALLSYKKNLQRQYQRIRYNIKNNSKVSSSFKTPGKDDD